MQLNSINGRTVSKLCLGTMTWGQQNSEADAHAQIEYALDNGINFMDTAEMYAVPPTPETQGLTEQYIGTWFKKTGRRDDWILATKAAGPSEHMAYLRGGPRHTREHLEAAVDASLQRLQTETIDLYQLHWPDRHTNTFGQLEYVHQEADETPVEDTLRALESLVNAGKIRAVGLSNETPWGIMSFLRESEKHGLPHVQSVQNAYSLLNRVFEIGHAEIAHRENVGLLAYSPLAMGLLTGKYRNGAKPEGSRLALFERFVRYGSEQAMEAADAYCDLAEQHGLLPEQMALAFVSSRPFVLSNIIGATTLDQLARNIGSSTLSLDDEVINGIEAIHRRLTNPAP
ncbi:aldo/keto reductase [Luminiphilus syltensis NOR5-1B]|uniref:Protein tas n=1 Tax=Luminiphilus syltensis NOR5-1B TaxID=565045 RepID=B8KSE2_9GAMM|nr:NADP(H)-dependent aldo-keto reductase [Luminiphilus syltensis]EED36729.1 aldo/keto reductase [Luminiphilus syltensis NOR5-1B]